MTTKRVARLFTVEQKFPCGPKSSCCGPVGQSTEQVTSLKNAIEGLGLGVEIYDLSAISDSTDNAPALKLFKAFGPQITPIISLDGQVVAMGQSDINETVSSIKSKL
jgi:hypothetical protein